MLIAIVLWRMIVWMIFGCTPRAESKVGVVCRKLWKSILPSKVLIFRKSDSIRRRCSSGLSFAALIHAVRAFVKSFWIILAVLPGILKAGVFGILPDRWYSIRSVVDTLSGKVAFLRFLASLATTVTVRPLKSKLGRFKERSSFALNLEFRNNHRSHHT